METISERIRKKLFEMQDLKYREFHAGLMPATDKETIIGVRTPDVRRLAKEIAGDPEIDVFLADLPHQYYEENNLHSFLIERIRDYETCLREVERFLPYIDNWATCDTQSPKVFARHTDELIEPIRRWLASGRTYTVRYGIGMLMKFYLDEKFRPEYLELVSSVRSEEYYVKMMAAWYFATALAKQYEDTVPYLQERRLDVWTHNKTIQKARESRRITAEQKAYLKALAVRVS